MQGPCRSLGDFLKSMKKLRIKIFVGPFEGAIWRRCRAGGVPQRRNVTRSVTRWPDPPGRLLDSELLDPIAQGPEGDAQRLGGRGLVVAVLFQSPNDRIALDVFDLLVECVIAVRGGGQR